MKRYLLILLVCLIVLTGCGRNKAEDYKNAVALYEAGDYAAAQTAFEELSGYEDSDQYAVNCGYQLEASEFLAIINTLVTE